MPSSSDSNDSNEYDSVDTGDIENVEDDADIPEDFDPITFFKSQKQLCYYKIIDKFFKKCSLEMRQKMVNIINSESIISLRVLEWVVTKSSNKIVNIKLSDNEYYSVNIMYKAQLKSYKKKNFDPFRRDKKFKYIYDKDNNKKVVTTLGQLNFFKWAITNKIIEHVEKNYDEINNAMIKFNKEEKVKKIEKKKKKIEIKTCKTKISEDNTSSISSAKSKTQTSNNSNISNLCLDINKFSISFD